MDPEEFHQLLRNEGYIVNVIKPDGNSLYRAISKEVLGDEENYVELREDLRDFLQANIHREPYSLYFADRDRSDIDREILQIGQDGVRPVLGGDLPMQAASEYCNHNIFVHAPNSPIRKFPELLTHENTIHLSWYPQNEHYNHLQVPETNVVEGSSYFFDEHNEADDQLTHGVNNKNITSRDVQNCEENDDYEENSAEDMEDEVDEDLQSGYEHEDYQNHLRSTDETEDEIGEDDQQPIADEAEDDFTLDFPALNPDDNNVADLSWLLKSYTFKYLGNKLFATSRNYLDILMLVPKQFRRDTLAETLHQMKGSEVYIVVDYSQGHIGKELLTDVDVREMYEVFKKRIDLPSESPMHTRSVWMSYSMVIERKNIIPLILSAIRYTWNGVRVEMLCKKSTGALATHLLNYYWNEMRQKIESDVNEILTYPNILFCQKCGDACPWRDNSWHLDLEGFVKEEFQDASRYGFWRRYNLFQSRFSPKAEAMQKLRTVFSSNDSFATLLGLLDENSTKYHNALYSSYLVLIFDGTNMHQYGGLTVQQLLHQQDVFKMIYAGCCLRQEFRSTHFERKSAIFNVLTKHSKMYFLRQKWYKSRDAARTDEAIVIEMLKVVVNRRRHDRTYPGFYLLNNTSSPSFLMRLNPRYMDITTRFCDSRIPIIRVDPENDVSFEDGVFTGNFKVETAVRMLPGPYKEREFQDVAEIYEKIRSQSSF